MGITKVHHLFTSRRILLHNEQKYIEANVLIDPKRLIKYFSQSLIECGTQSKASNFGGHKNSPPFITPSFPLNFPTLKIMEALSTTQPVSSLLPKSFTSTNNPHLHHLKPPPLSSNAPNPISTTTLCNKANQSSFKPLSAPHLPFSPPSPLKQPSLQTHRRASTGYAAALLDVAVCDGALVGVAKDARRVKRIVKAVLGDEGVEEGKKGEVVKRAVEGGGFYARLVVLVRMLVGKGKVGAVEEVMEEFGRLWEELCGVKRVVPVRERRRSSLACEG